MVVHTRHAAESCVRQSRAKVCGLRTNGSYFAKDLFKCIFMNEFQGQGWVLDSLKLVYDKACHKLS